MADLYRRAGHVQHCEERPGNSGAPYLAAIKTYATPEGFIPEQIWTPTTTLPDSWQVVTPPPFTFGTPTKSMAPLNWAMGEYISLLASTQAGKVVDIPSIVCARYSNCVIKPAAGQVGVTISVNAKTQPGQYMYVIGSTDALGNWNTDLGLPVDSANYLVWNNTVNLPASGSVQYKYYRKNAVGSVTWENLPGNGNRTQNVLPSGSTALNDTVGGQTLRSGASLVSGCGRRKLHSPPFPAASLFSDATNTMRKEGFSALARPGFETGTAFDSHLRRRDLSYSKSTARAVLSKGVRHPAALAMRQPT